MKRMHVMSIVLLILMIALIAPAMACHVTVTKSSESSECETVSFTINVSATGMPWNNYKLVVVDSLIPDGEAVITGASDGGAISDHTVTWEMEKWMMGNKDFTYTMTVNTKAGGMNNVTATLYQKCYCGYGCVNGWKKIDDDKTSISYDAPETCPTTAPEFPTLAVPVMMLVGLVGAIWFIKKGGE